MNEVPSNDNQEKLIREALDRMENHISQNTSSNLDARILGSFRDETNSGSDTFWGWAIFLAAAAIVLAVAWPSMFPTQNKSGARGHFGAKQEANNQKEKEQQEAREKIQELLGKLAENNEKERFNQRKELLNLICDEKRLELYKKEVAALKDASYLKALRLTPEWLEKCLKLKSTFEFSIVMKEGNEHPLNIVIKNIGSEKAVLLPYFDIDLFSKTDSGMLKVPPSTNFGRWGSRENDCFLKEIEHLFDQIEAGKSQTLNTTIENYDYDFQSITGYDALKPGTYVLTLTYRYDPEPYKKSCGKDCTVDHENADAVWNKALQGEAFFTTTFEVK